MSIVRVNGSNLGLSRDEVKEGEGSPTPVAEEKIIKSTEKIDSKTRISKAAMMPLTEEKKEVENKPEDATPVDATPVTETIPKSVKEETMRYLSEERLATDEDSGESEDHKPDFTTSDMAVSSSMKLTTCLLRTIDVITKMMSDSNQNFTRRRNEIIMEELQTVDIENSVLISAMDQPYGNILAEAIVDHIRDELQCGHSVDVKDPVYRHAIASYYELNHSMSIVKLNMAIDVAFKILAK